MGGGATLTMGDTDGAFDAAMTEVGIGGAIADDHTTHTGFSGNSGFDGTHDGQIARFSYAFEGFTGHVSAEIDDTGVQSPVWGIGAAWAGDLGGINLGVGLGYQTRDSAFNALDTIVGVSLSTTMSNGLQAIANYSQASGSAPADQTHWAIGLGYSANALTIGVNYGQMTDIGGVAGADADGWGVAVDYDLGGGAQIQAGYGSSNPVAPAADFDTWSFGVAMSF